MAQVITSQNIDTLVFESKDAYLLDFWATWCGPCSMLSKVIEDAEDELTSKVKIGKINVDDERILAQKFGISSIPALFLVKDGEVVDSTVGFMEKEQLLDFINNNI